MKQLFTSLLLAGVAPIALYGQTIVNTTPENKKAILEEFTGIHCVYCPEGHQIAEGIINNNPGNAFAINIHQGGYATPGAGEPDFRTPFGNAIANQTGLTGYPSGTVNRHVFSGSKTILDRGQWTGAVNQILAMSSYLNMAVEASIDIDTRTLTVHVEAYYTGNSPQSTNKLNVVLMQNDTKGPQTGGNQGNNYNHMRRLVHMLTGQWGEVINTTTAGSFVDKTYTYVIPTAYNNIEAVLSDMEIVVFMTETNQEIISGNGAFPSLIGLEYQNDVALVAVDDIPRVCEASIEPVVKIQNSGENTITSVEIAYGVNGVTAGTHTWTGSLTSLRTATIQLPAFDYADNGENEFFATITSVDQNPDNNTLSKEFDRAPTAESAHLTLTLNTDGQGSQTRWILKKSNGQTVQQGNNYGNNQTYTIDINLPIDDCYSFRILDTGNNGGATFTLKDDNGKVLSESVDGNYGGGFTDYFNKGELGTNEQLLTSVNVYPNPSNGLINVSSDQKIDQVSVYDLSGRLIHTMKGGNNKVQLNLTAFGKGNYILKIENGNSVTTKKVIVK